MTETSETTDTENAEAKTDDLAAEEAHDAFVAGFKKASGDDSPAPTKAEEPKGDAVTDPEDEGAAADTDVKPEDKDKTSKADEPGDDAKGKETEKTPDVQEELAQMNERFQKLEGRYGRLLQDFNQMANSQKSAATQAADKEDSDTPTEKQVQAALRNPEKMKELIEEYPTFQPVLDELQALREDMSGTAQKIDQDAIVEQAVQKATYQMASENLQKTHPAWEQDVRQDEFKSWAYEGGPSEIDMARVNEQARYDQEAANKTLQDLRYQYPDWWDEKGRLLFSTNPTDIGLMMDRFKDHQDAASSSQQTAEPDPEKAKKQQLKKQRLEQAAQPLGTGDTPATGLNDQEAFMAGFKKAQGH